MKSILVIISAALLTSCGSLTSTTYIPPQQSFELGKNQHRPFRVDVVNGGTSTIELHRAPISGGTHSYVKLAPGEHTRVKVEANTAVVFNNANSDTATIQLKVHGDTGLGMQYQK